MEVNNVSNTFGAVNNNTTVSTAGKNANSLDINDFFTLLAAELQNQSMYDTVDNSEFMSQMAQYSSLQQMNELSETISQLMSVSLVGKQVTAQIQDAANNTALITGVVENVEISNGKSYLRIGTYRVDPKNITSIQ